MRGRGVYGRHWLGYMQGLGRICKALVRVYARQGRICKALVRVYARPGAYMQGTG